MLLSDFFKASVEADPSACAVRAPDGEFNYAGLYDRASRLASAFLQHGIAAGDRVALVGYPSAALVAAECAAVAMGAIPLAIDPVLTLPEVQRILADADPSLLVYDSDRHSLVASVSCDSLRFRFCSESGGDDPALDDLARRASPLTAWWQGSPDEVALLIYTSGTTGLPRGVMHTHRSISNWAFLRRPHEPFKPHISLVPNLTHLSGQAGLWARISYGACAVLPPPRRLTAGVAVDLIEEHRLTMTTLMGDLLRDVVTLPGIENRHPDSISVIAHGGSPAHPATLRKAAALFPTALILEGYASTESGMCISLLLANHCLVEDRLDRLASVGHPGVVAALGHEPMAVRIVDTGGVEVPPGEIGEVQCRGSQVMAGYWRDPEATRSAIQDGWLAMGDLGRVDSDGYLYLMDRKKDMIIVSGMNVYSCEVEAMVATHPAIREVAVIGIPRDPEGEQVAALVVLQDGCFLALEELQRFCAGRIAPYKIPTHLEMRDRLPRNGIQKVNKAELRGPYWTGRERRVN